MANDGISVDIDGNPTGFRRAMQEMLQSSKDTAKGVESAFGSLPKIFSGAMIGIASLTAAIAASVNTAAKFGEESIKLGRALGISATEASLLKEALDANNTSQDEFVNAAKKLSKQVRDNEGELNAMGLATRDAHGNLRSMTDLMLDAIAVLNGYKSGTDRAIAGQVLFGKGFELTSNLAVLNKETVAELNVVQRELGAIVGADNVTAWQEFDDAGDKAHLTMKAMQLAIGNALLPALTSLSNWFVSIGPAAVTGIKGAFGGLVSTFYFLTTGVTVLWETINAMVVSVAEPIRALAVAISKALSGDWTGAASEVRNVGAAISRAWGKAFNEMTTSAQNTRDKVWKLFAQPGPDAAAPGGGKSAAGLIKTEGKDKVTKEESLMPYYEAALAEEKRLAYERDALRGYTKEQELAFWQLLLANANIGSKDRLAIERKASALIIDIKRTEAKQRQELDSEGIRSGETLAMGRVEAERAAAQTALDLNQISKAQFLTLEESFEQKRFEIQQAALVERMKLMEKDPNFNVVEYTRLKNQMLEVEQQHNLKRSQIQGQAAVESQQIWKSLGDRMGNLWDQGTQAMLNGTLTWSNSMRAIGASIVAWFATDVVGKKVKTWLLGETAQTGATQTGVAMRLAIEGWAALKSVGIWAAAAIKNIMVNAWAAMAAAWQAIVGIPYVGPVLAPIAAAAAFAGVASLAHNVMSAEGGYDIPRGINPMTQLHAEEMVLPKQHANVIRDLADGGGGAGGSTIINMTINTPNADSFRASQDQIVAELYSQMRPRRGV